MSTLAERPSTPARNPLTELHAHGQSVWLDYIRRSLMRHGFGGHAIKAAAGKEKKPA